MRRRSLYILAVVTVLLIAVCASVLAAVHVRGYVRKDGTYVQPHYRSNPDGNFNNNWSTKGNTNPYTGKGGTKVAPPTTYRYSSSPAPVYQAPSYTPPSAPAPTYTPQAYQSNVSPPLAVNAAATTESAYEPVDTGSAATDLGWYNVVRVVDGDTIEVDGSVKVRLIGIDTPETVHPSKPVERMGKEASAATTRLALGQRVKIHTDVQERDKYGRLLGYVYLPDGSMLNSELVRRGYAKASTYPPNVKYQSLFLDMEREARAAKRGLWAPVETAPVVTQYKAPRISPVISSALVHITRTGAKFHSAGCRYLARSDIPIALSDAKARGYTACSVCGGGAGTTKTYEAPVVRTSTTVGDIVHITRTGSKYHAAGCRYLSRSDIPISRSAAIRQGCTPCSICGGG